MQGLAAKPGRVGKVNPCSTQACSYNGSMGSDSEAGYKAPAVRCQQHGLTSAMVASRGWIGAAKPVVTLFFRLSNCPKSKEFLEGFISHLLFA